MDYRLLFRQRALSDLSEIVGHIAQDDEEFASRFAGALLDHVDLLCRFPQWGTPLAKGWGCVSWSTPRFSSTTKSMRRSVWLRSFTSATGRESQPQICPSRRQQAEWAGIRQPPKRSHYGGHGGKSGNPVLRQRISEGLPSGFPRAGPWEKGWETLADTRRRHECPGPQPLERLPGKRTPHFTTCVGDILFADFDTEVRP